MAYWSKRALDRCERELGWHKTLNVLSSFVYCLFAVVFLWFAFWKHRRLLVRRDIFLLVGGGSALFFLVGVFSALYHGQPYLVWERADLACILLFFLFLEFYLSFRVFCVTKKPTAPRSWSHASVPADEPASADGVSAGAFLGSAALLFVAIGLTVLSIAFGLEDGFAAMVAAHLVYLLCLILLLAWLSLPHRATSPWRKKTPLLFVSGALFLLGSVLWSLEEDHCSRLPTRAAPAAATGHIWWHVLSGASIFTLLLFLLEIRAG